MSKFFRKVHAIFTDSVLRGRILFVLFGLVIFRVMAAIPLPNIDPAAVQKAVANNQALQLFGTFSGSGLSTFSIVMLGVGPYITASIIMQLMTVLSPQVKSMYHEEGEIGRKKFTQISRLVTVPLAFLQAYGLLVLFKNNGAFPATMLPITMFLNVVVAVAGSMALMFLGELMTEKGIGNGTSLIIFAGIITRLVSEASTFTQNFNGASDIATYAGAAIATAVVLAGIIAFTEAERPVPIAYAKSVAGGRQVGSGIATYLPLRVNQAGVIPIVFALSMFLFPQLIGGFLTGLANPSMHAAGLWITEHISKNGVGYNFVYAALVFFFTFFYTAITFEPENVAKNLQQSGAFVPGIRPGVQTAEYLAKVVLRITFLGALFLSVVAVLPFVMQTITHNQALAVGGTSILIAVSVVTDIIKKLDAQLSMREY